MHEPSVSVLDLADELRVRKQRIFKVLKRLGIQTTARRDAARGNQMTATLTSDEAAAVRRELARTAHAESIEESDVQPTTNCLIESAGVFYLIQLEPDHDAGRFKVGFTTDMTDRVRKHRCAAPLLRIVRTWPCRNTWERAAIDSATSGCERLHTEVFRAASLAEVEARANAFFAVMPSPGER